MRVTSKGQVTIPLPIRERMGLLPDTEIEFNIEGDRVILKKAKEKSSRGKDIVNRIRGKAKAGMSTNEIMALTRE
jgi:AbrB family looped-hinge helix DNA binding protein